MAISDPVPKSYYEVGVAVPPLEGKSMEQLKSMITTCLLYTSPSPRDATLSRMPSSA